MKKQAILFIALLSSFVLLPGVSLASVLTTFAGGGTYFPQVGMAATDIALATYSVRHGLSRSVYIAAWGIGNPDGVIRIDPYGKIDAIVSGPEFADDIWVDYDGTIIYSESTGFSCRIIRIGLDNTIIPVAGNGACGYSGDNGPALDAQVWGSEGLTIDADGNLYFSQPQTGVIRRVDRASGIITTVAGGFNNPRKIVADSVGNLLVSDRNNGCIKMVDKNGVVTTIIEALNRPNGIDVDQWGNIYFADSGNNQVMKRDPSGVITAVATVLDPNGVSVDPDGNIYIAETDVHMVKKLAFDPVVDSHSPTSGAPGTKVVIRGKYFGSVMGGSTVTLDATVLEPTNWSNTELHVIIPSGAKSGNIVVHAEGGSSNAVYFRVTKQ